MGIIESRKNFNATKASNILNILLRPNSFKKVIEDIIRVITDTEINDPLESFIIVCLEYKFILLILCMMESIVRVDHRIQRK